MSDKKHAGKSNSSGKRKRRGIISEILGLVTARKTYWLIPIIVALLVLMGIVILGGTSAAPFIYTLF